jgi:tRNA(adenine34) deaminase
MTDEHFMQQALRQAKMAFEADEIPVGAIIVLNNSIIAKAHNQTELLKDSTAHAEILALTTAYQFLGSKYVPNATMYVTLEPCVMCSGALYWSKIGRVVWGGADAKNGFSRICNFHVNGENSVHPFHPKTVLQFGIMANECTQLMTDFFKSKR